ncbi:MAG: S46 family peptidase, partial [Candidatus Polarisedimenticolia bacterium]
MKKTLLVLATLLLPAAAFADEGMWTFDHFPSEKVEKKYGFKPTQEWLDHVRLSSVRLAEGCSGSFVSEDGLVM